MNSLLTRRRVLMAANVGSLVPDGYIKHGLVFFLDGKQLLSSRTWTDIIGKKTFSLTNCTVSSNGLILDGTAYGEYDGAVSKNWEGETIEVVFTGANEIYSKALFCQPKINGSVGASMRFGNGGTSGGEVQTRIAMGLDGIQRELFQAHIGEVKNRISRTADQCVINGICVTGTSSTSYTSNSTGRTYLGCNRFTLDVTPNAIYTGTLHAIRIYNRKLTKDEMISNQHKDITYYGSGGGDIA